MFVRLTILQVKSDKLDEAVKIFGESVIPAAKLQKGFCGGYLLTDRNTGKGIAMSLWDSEGDAVASEQSGYYQEQVIDKFRDLYTVPPVREGYEVSLQV